MPSKKRDIEIELDTEDGTEVFKFRPFSLHSLQRTIQKTTNMSPEEFRDFDLSEYDIDREDLLSMDAEDLPPELREKIGGDMDVSEFFAEMIGRCESHTIVDRDLMRSIITDPYADEKKREWAKNRIDEADHYVGDFNPDEQKQIVDCLINDVGDVEEGRRDAENFQGD